MSDDPPKPTPPGRSTRPGAFRSIVGAEIRIGAILGALARRRIAVLVGFGVALRVARTLARLPMTLDEGSLANNIVSRPLSGLFAELTQTQLAPAGFLVVEWASSRAFGPTDLALRLVPTLGAVGSVFLFLAIARKILRPDALAIGLALFAVAGDPIAYGAQIKQYSTDLALGLAVTLFGLRTAVGPLTIAKILGFSAFGASVVWFSHPSAFVLAGVGSVLIAGAALRGEFRRVGMFVLMSAAWATSFALVYAISLDQLGHRRDMWAFWNFAFPPVPPSSIEDAFWPIRRFLYLFLNPLDFSTPCGWVPSILPPLAFFIVGVGSLWRRDRQVILILAAPLMITLAAAYPRLYPFHGRLLVFLIPAFLLPIAEGAALACEVAPGRATRVLLLATILFFPTLGAVAHLTNLQPAADFNPLGDLRPARLRPERFPMEPSPPTRRYGIR